MTSDTRYCRKFLLYAPLFYVSVFFVFFYLGMLFVPSQQRVMELGGSLGYRP